MFSSLSVISFDVEEEKSEGGIEMVKNMIVDE